MAKKIVADKKVGIILMERIKNLGSKFQIVKVAASYARNFLIPNKMAVLADNKNMNDLKHKIAKHENEKANKVEDLKGIVSKFQTETPLVIMRKINEKQHLFDKVDSHDIAKEIEAQTGLHVDTDAIVMAHKIDTIGEYHVTLQTSSIKESFAVEVRAE